MSETVSTGSEHKELKEDETKPETVIFQKKVQEKAIDLETLMVDVLRRFNGWKCVSASRLMSYDDTNDSPEVTSNLAKRLRLGYIMSGNGDLEKFKELLVGAKIVYIQVHMEIPTLSKDGCYNNIDIHGKPFRTMNVAEYPLITADEFKPFMVMRDDKGVIGKVSGDYYHQISKEEAMAVLMMNQESGMQKPEEK